MALTPKTGNKTHDEAVAAACGSLQSVAGTPGVSAATLRTASITYYRAVLASAKTNGLDQGAFIDALWQLGSQP